MFDGTVESHFCAEKKLLLIGPSPEKSTVGGVVQHMRILQKIPVLKTAIFYDPGSSHGGGDSVWHVIANCYGLKKIIKNNNISQIWINSSIYMSSFIKLLLMLSVLRGCHNIKIRVFFHGGRFHKIKMLKILPVRFFIRKIIEKVTCFHFLSQEQGQGFNEVFPLLNWKRFSNYLPTNTLLLRKKNKKVLLFVGRLVLEKGVFDIIEAFNILYNTRGVHDVELWFVGDGSAMGELKILANKYAPNHVKLWGGMSNIELEKLYQEASILLLPSYHDEGLPYVIIEAMRSGLSVIASSSGAITDLIKDEKNGFIVPIKSPEVIENYINRLISDKELCDKICKENSRFFMENLSLDAAEKYYNKLRSGVLT